MNEARLHVVVRADASQTIGTGHVIRCLSLADGLRRKGASVLFVCSTQDGDLGDLIAGRGFQVARLPYRDPSRDPGGHPDALPIAWRQDAQDTAAILKELPRRPDWLVVDHYSLDIRWETFLRPLVGRVLVVDDLTVRQHDCELLLNQNLLDDDIVASGGQPPGSTALLLGPQYALLQPTYAALHKRIPLREGPVKRLLIFLGDTGPSGVTGIALRAFLDLGREDIDADVVLALRSPHADRIREMADGHPNVRVHHDLPSLAPLIAQADLAIGAAGTTSWERLCLGLPSVVIALAENQRAIADGLHRRGLARWIGDLNRVDVDAVCHELTTLVACDIDVSWSRRCHDAVDGRGVERVTTAMLLSLDEPIAARHIRVSDTAITNCWTDGTRSVRQSFQRRLRDVAMCRLFVLEAGDGVSVGSVRFLKCDIGWNVEGNIATPFRGDENVETRCLCSALLAFRAEEPGLLQLATMRWTHKSSAGTPDDEGATPDSGSRKWNIAICADSTSWINPSIAALVAEWITQAQRVSWVHNADHLPLGDICFFLSYGRIVSAEIRRRHTHNLVVHESDLPRGRGWSPLTWQILDGSSQIAVTLFEAADAVDSGPIYSQKHMLFAGSELVDELRAAQATVTQQLCREFVAGYPESAERRNPQEGEPTYYRRRTAADSRLDPEKPLSDQFNLLRVVDNDRYPAWMEVAGCRYQLRVKRL